jgi:hypothetical protein
MMHVGLRTAAVAVLLNTVPGNLAAAPRTSAVPVRVGGEDHVDACGIARVRAANLPVRAGPGRRFAIRDRLASAQRVFVCGGRAGWSAVVYGKTDCGVGGPRPLREAYQGPCRSGWVDTRRLEGVAG